MMRGARVLALVSLMPLFLASAACSRAAPDATPEGAVNAWLDKMEAATKDARMTREAYELLGPVARANLEARAARASNVQGRRIEPFEMLAEGRFGLKFRPKTMTARIAGEQAIVDVLGDEQTEHAEVHCTREASGPGHKPGGWRVEPELPDVVPPPKRAPDAPALAPSYR